MCIETIDTNLIFYFEISKTFLLSHTSRTNMIKEWEDFTDLDISLARGVLLAPGREVLTGKTIELLGFFIEITLIQGMCKLGSQQT